MQNNNDMYIDLAKQVLWASLLGILGYTMLSILLIFYPFLFMESSIEYGIKEASISMLASGLVIGLIIGFLPALVLIGMYLPVVLAFHYGILSGKGFWTVFALMLVVYIIVGLSIGGGLFRNIDLNSIEHSLEEAIGAQREALSETMTDLELRRFEQALRQSFEFSRAIMPATSLIFAMIGLYVNYLLAGRRLLTKRILIVQPPMFSNLSIPKETLLVLGGFFLLGLIFQAMDVTMPIDITINGVAIFAFVYFINGLAFVSFYMNRLNIRGFVRILIYIMIFTIFVIPLIIIVLGLVDSLFDIRRLKGNGRP